MVKLRSFDVTQSSETLLPSPVKARSHTRNESRYNWKISDIDFGQSQK